MKKTILLLLITTLFFACNKEDESIDESLMPAVPKAVQPIDVTSTSFTAKWEKAENASSYEIDLAKDRYFNIIIKTVSSTTETYGFTGLESNIRHFYRVRAKNGSNVSANSNAIDIITLPEPPMALAATSIKSNGFTVNWNWSPGITIYHLYISTEDFPHDDSKNLPAFNGLKVYSNTHIVTGLNSSTTYYYVLRAANGNVLSANSNSISCTTLN